MLKGGSVLNLLELQAQGKSIREIVRETGYSRNTVRTYLRNEGKPERAKREAGPSKLDPFKQYLDEMMGLGVYNCEVLLERLRELGYAGGKTLVKDYVQPHRPPRRNRAARRFETLPGKQAQVDWGICTYYDIHGTKRKVPVFVMILGYSRAKYVEFVRRCDIYSFLRCMYNAFVYFGGVPEVILTDRMKTVLIGMGDDHKPQWHSLFADFALAMGFIPKVCRARRPQTKGKVERTVRFVKENFLPNRRFTTLDDLNAQAKAWCDKVNRNIHGTTGERPVDRLKDEPLQKLVGPDKLTSFLSEERKVDSDGYFSFDGVRYGVPWHYVGTMVRVRTVGGQLEVWLGDQRIATHERSNSWSGLQHLPDQYKGMPKDDTSLRPVGAGIQIQEVDVEYRPLSIYEQLSEDVG